MTSSLKRCPWCGTDPDYVRYHDEEWGKKVTDENVLFEFLILEAAQAGLSWLTILRKREGYRRLFAGFDPHEVSQFTLADIDRICQDTSIVRHRGKISSAVASAQIFLDIQDEFGSFYAYLYSFMPKGEPLINAWASSQEVAVTSPESDAISSDLRKRGLKFFGSTICYAYMQAVGMVNDHLTYCSFR